MKRGLAWFKFETGDSSSPETGALLGIHSFKGFYFWVRLLDIMAEYYSIWDPGCYKFNEKWFFSQFDSYLDKRTCKKILEFLHEQERVYFLIQNREIFIYCPEFLKRQDEYRQKCMKDADEGKIEKPSNAGSLHVFCEAFVKKESKSTQKNVNNCIDNKEDKSINVGTNAGYDVGTSSLSSSRGTNNKSITIFNDKESKREQDATVEQHDGESILEERWNNIFNNK